MRKRYIEAWTVAVAVLAIAVGCVSARHVPLVVWSPAFPGLLTALSLLAGAALVRMARNAPITSPSTFDEEDLNRFFSTLEKLASRLFWVFVQSMLAIAITLLSVVFVGDHHPAWSSYPKICKVLSGTLAGASLWLTWRLVTMAYGDLAFIRLQHQILNNALARERRKSAAKVVDSSPTRFSPGRFGGIAGGS